VFDDARLADAVREAAPDAIVHQLTDLPASLDVRRINEVYDRVRCIRRRAPPRRVPAFLGRFVLGEALTAWLTTMRGASNARARRELGWQPRYASWRTGFAETLPAS
jgi:nucleoside-diphosphate-sugar epimerase